jgi:hypothetical protein
VSAVSAVSAESAPPRGVYWPPQYVGKPLPGWVCEDHDRENWVEDSPRYWVCRQCDPAYREAEMEALAAKLLHRR